MIITIETTISKEKSGKYVSSLALKYDGITVDSYTFWSDRLLDLHLQMIKTAQDRIAFFGMFDVAQMDKLKGE